MYTIHTKQNQQYELFRLIVIDNEQNKKGKKMCILG